MSTPIKTTSVKNPSWVNVEAGNLDTFIKQVSQQTQLVDWPHATAVEQNLLVYAGDDVREASLNEASRQALMREWAQALSVGPGIVAIKNAMPDHDAIDSSNELFSNIIDEQKKVGGGSGDHFAKPGANDRVWNALEKHCVADPQSFAQYYANNTIAMISQAWLGRGYQITAQVNRVNPGGNAQIAHRDYHLGFMSPEQMLEFPEHVHSFCQMLTLQGAVAHCDMPLESGPTLYLPYSHLHLEGYIAFTRDEYQAYFNEHHRQLPLNKGDMVFFNPAVMHGAGENKTTDIYRLANLLQVSSAFGRCIETVDRTRMLDALYPTLLDLKTAGETSQPHLNNVVAASAEGYSFPTNLDSDPPMAGLAPQTQNALVHESLNESATFEQFQQRLQSQANRKYSVPRNS